MRKYTGSLWLGATTALLCGCAALFEDKSVPPAPGIRQQREPAVSVPEIPPARAPTVRQQSSRPDDRELVAQIRRAVLQEEDLSLLAGNVKIISSEGIVTLRGPVRSEEEKLEVERIAARIAGNENVRSAITVLR